jgi:hypothetical protein
VLPAADANTSFDLFDTRAQAFQPAARNPQTYELIFNESVRGLRAATLFPDVLPLDSWRIHVASPAPPSLRFKSIIARAPDQQPPG